MDHTRHEVAEESGAIAYLLAVDAALPGGAAMHEMIAECIKACKNDACFVRRGFDFAYKEVAEYEQNAHPG